ncbi:uncharacterized protein LOC6551158 [Drosophila erecta]|uniref:Uncharacterized protein n=1 Tax=Drosophila erecta TaxID=7220 RepID=B3NSV6_DROER|nr:uncharacterized protein LOC6551158 [Drosophila erecta]EDV45786.2 uncharacterized protein Dere_GG18698 [Drosophila erecta]
MQSNRTKMFNKTIVVALLVCACYLGTIEARPGLTDVASGPVGAAAPLLTGAVGGLTAGAANSAVPQLSSVLGQSGPLGLAQGLGGLSG